MASSSAPVRPARYLLVFLVLLILAYVLVFFTGSKKAEAKLGIDLQGGTRVTLTARTPDGSRPSREALDQAQQIIADRVDGLGVSGSEVIVDGDNLVITVPGNDSSDARNLGQTARLYIRPVIGQPIPIDALLSQLNQQPGAPGVPGAPPGVPGAPPGVPGAPPGVPGPPPGLLPPGVTPPGAPPAGDGTAGAGTPGDGTTAPPAQPRPFPDQPFPNQPPPAPPTPAPGTTGAPVPGGPPGTPPGTPPPPPGPVDPLKEQADRIAKAKALRQSTSPLLQNLAAIELAKSGCSGQDPLTGNDDPNLPLVTCDQDHQAIYLLDKSIISGDQIKNASAGMNQQSGQNVVEVEFKPDAANVWADFTAANVGTQTAFVLDTQVVSAPEIQEAIPGGRTQITGNFSSAEAKSLANILKYGSLPLSFEASEAETVSATLGLTSLRAGLLAGAVGLALVLLYSLVYYRVLGVLVTLSLVASGAMVYAILVLLGRYIGYTLDLAGIAGLIIGIGTTADSFVVFFERVKDEIREGRSYRSAVPRGWTRARKTILSGNAVSFLAAAVLYFLAIGQVKGFAFTLGLTTILDVVVVILVTWPLVYLTSKSARLAKPSYNGLGAVQQIARERRAGLERSRQAQATKRG